MARQVAGTRPGASTYREFDGTGRRVKKVVTHAGPYDGTVVYFYDDRWRIVETRDGSGNVTRQFVHGTQYIDELVMMRAKDKGDLYVHQDANWNVIATTDLGGHVAEYYSYTPYGQVTIDQRTGFGDRDGDGDVDAADKGTPGTTCTGTLTGPCRILDLDFDDDYDNADATLFDNLPQGNQVRPGPAGLAARTGVRPSGAGAPSHPNLRVEKNRSLTVAALFGTSQPGKKAATRY